MSKKFIKLSRSQAKEKLDNQYNIAADLINTGIETIKKNKRTSRTEVDNFRMRYEQWRGITIEVLNEVFVSTDYSYKFRQQQSSEVKYVSSSWQPDIEYYIRKELKPKIDYLSILTEDMSVYDEITPGDRKEEEQAVMEPDIDNLNVAQLLGALKPSQLWAVIVICCSVVGGSFYLGYEVNSWKQDKDKYNLTNENIKLKEDTENLNKQLKSTLKKLEEKEKTITRTNIN